MWVENIHFEHGDRVWPDRFIPEPIDAKLAAPAEISILFQLISCRFAAYLGELSSDAFVKLFCELDFIRSIRKVVN